MDDYIVADYYNPLYGSVNLYVAYYSNPSSKWYLHTPSGCLPSAGWDVLKESDVSVNEIDGARMRRLVVRQQDGHNMLVYYVFKDDKGYWLPDLSFRSAQDAIERYIKKIISIGSIRINSSSHSLIRVYSRIDGSGDRAIVKADNRIRRFLVDVNAILPDYLSGVE